MNAVNVIHTHAQVVHVDVYHYPAMPDWSAKLALPAKYTFRCMWDTPGGKTERLRLHIAETDKPLPLGVKERRRVSEALKDALEAATGKRVMAFDPMRITGGER